MADRKFITLEKIRLLHEAIGFLDDYKVDQIIDVHVGEDINKIGIEETNMLLELGRINIRREKIIKKLCQIKN